MPDTPHVPASDEVAWLRARVAELEELTARLREAARDRDELAAAQLAARDAQIAARDAQIAGLAAQVEELRRRLDKDSSTSSKPPSSDSPYIVRRSRGIGRCGRGPGAGRVSSPGRSPRRCGSHRIRMRRCCAGRPRAAAAVMT